MVKSSDGGVLAIHLGWNVGYCYDGKPQVWVLPKERGNGYVGWALRDALMDFCSLSKPDRIVLSNSLDDIRGESDEGRQQATLIVGMIMIVQVFACRRHLAVDLVHPNDVHEGLFERADMPARALKAALTGLAKRRGFSGLDPDAANALALHEFSTHMKAAA